MPSAAFLPPRRLILAVAVLLALAVSMASPFPSAIGQTAQAAAAPDTAGAAPPAKAADQAKRSPRTLSVEIKETADSPPDSAAANGDKAGRGSTVDEGGRRPRMHLRGANRDYDSFEQFVHGEPATAAMIVSIVAIVFLSPALIVALIIFYRMRKARLLNETLVRLAERGVVAPAQAMQALSDGELPPAVSAAAGTASVLEQAQQIRTRAATSDLRKGVILGAIGLGLTAYSSMADGSPNALGLILLFVGIGYGVLWWFESRPLGSGAGSAGRAGSGS